MIHIHLQECQSTQQEVIQRIDAAKGRAILVSTENQTLGRGQRGKQWKFYPGSLAFSFTMKPPAMAQLASMEVAILFCRYVGENVKLKWPNDLIFEGKKCGGILCQLVHDVLIVGMGINITQGEIGGDQRGEPEACSLHASGKRRGGRPPKAPGGEQLHFNFEPTSFSWEGSHLQEKWPYSFYQYLLANRLGDCDLIIEEFYQYCDHMKKNVSIENQNIKGTFIGVDLDGAAIIEQGEKKHRIISGSLIYN